MRGQGPGKEVEIGQDPKKDGGQSLESESVRGQGPGTGGVRDPDPEREDAIGQSLGRGRGSKRRRKKEKNWKNRLKNLWHLNGKSRLKVHRSLLETTLLTSIERVSWGILQKCTWSNIPVL